MMGLKLEASELELVVKEMRRLGVKSLSRGPDGINALELWADAPPADLPAFDQDPHGTSASHATIPAPRSDVPAAFERAVNIMRTGRVPRESTDES
jgi:hypothetical protein